MGSSMKYSKTKIAVVIIALIIIFTFLYAMFLGVRGFKMDEYTIKNNKITEDFDGFKIVHITDIHYNDKSLKKELTKIIEDINGVNPDIVVFTGDLVTNSLNEKEHKDLVKILSNLETKIGKYAVNGNHDVRYDKWDLLIEESGFINLNDSYDLIDNGDKHIFISGLSSNIKNEKSIEERSKDIFNYIENDKDSIYNILLIHEPDFVDDIDYGKFDMILSGHSHMGQVRLPFVGAIIKIPGAKKYYNMNYYDLNGTGLYISTGTGTSGLNIRLFNKPSYNLYKLVAE